MLLADEQVKSFNETPPAYLHNKEYKRGRRDALKELYATFVRALQESRKRNSRFGDGVQRGFYRAIEEVNAILRA